MNCSEVSELISAYYDGELVGSIQTTATVHFESCSRCSAELASFNKLSTAMAELRCPWPPDLWSIISAQITASNRVERNESFPLGPMEWLETSALRFAAAIAATLLMTGWIGYSSWHGWRQHAEVANDFLHYATQLQRDPAAAREYFVIKYGGQPVDDNVDVERLAYRPTVASGLPPGYTLVASDVLRMPGCECIGSLCKRDDGSALAIFEHETEQPHWFADQPSIQVQCSGQPTQNVELGTDRLAATWPINNRYLTVIGARDIEEVTQLVSNFTTRTGDL